MGNNNYVRGAAFERQVKAYLEAQGWFAIRAAGSHGLVDVLAITPTGSVCFIQCKTGKAKMSKQDKMDLDALASKYGAIPMEVTPTSYKEQLNG